jgi:hypothetical protein
MPATPTGQPLPPGPQHFGTESPNGRAIARDAVVRKVAPKFLTQSAVLIRDRLVSVEPTPLSNRLDGPAVMPALAAATAGSA